MNHLLLESVITELVYRTNALHNQFSRGTAEEINRLISDEFEGWLYRPGSGGLQRLDAQGIRDGNWQAARYYEGKAIRFLVSGITVLPQASDQAAVSYQITFHQGDALVRALVLEVWRRESDGEWRMIRWYEEKGCVNEVHHGSL